LSVVSRAVPASDVFHAVVSQVKPTGVPWNLQPRPSAGLQRRDQRVVVIRGEILQWPLPMIANTTVATRPPHGLGVSTAEVRIGFIEGDDDCIVAFAPDVECMISSTDVFSA
jgi:hypothetical protein